MSAIYPPTPEQDRAINLAIVRAVMRFRGRRTAQQAKLAGDAETADQFLAARSQLRDRMDCIVTFDRVGTGRSITGQ